MSDREATNLQYHENVSGSSSLLAADNLSVTARTLVADKAKHTLKITRISVSIITAAAQTLTFADSNGNVLAMVAASAPAGSCVNFNFGPDGVACEEGYGLTLANSAAGVAAAITWVGYRHRTTG